MQELIGGVAVMPLIFGLVEFAKELGLKGRALTVLSLVLGVGLSIAVQLSNTLPITFGEWLMVVVTGLAFGLATSKGYDYLEGRGSAE